MDKDEKYFVPLTLAKMHAEALGDALAILLATRDGVVNLTPSDRARQQIQIEQNLRVIGEQLAKALPMAAS
jgi:hypothetical protein